MQVTEDVSKVLIKNIAKEEVGTDKWNIIQNSVVFWRLQK
jgi:hypothetical protein